MVLIEQPVLVVRSYGQDCSKTAYQFAGAHMRNLDDCVTHPKAHHYDDAQID